MGDMEIDAPVLLAPSIRTTSDDQLLSVPEVALQLGLSKPTVRAHIDSGELPAVNVGAAYKFIYRVRADDLRRFLEARASRSAAEQARVSGDES